MKTKSYSLNISRQIDVNFRNYALYVLENRGIPSFYDGLTNVQRFIMMNAPTNYNKTISLVGSCISDGYHHGDKSLTGAINKLARPFGNSEQLLQGDGFFGTPVDSTAAAARYTSIRINPAVAGMLQKSSFLNTKNEESSWNPLWLDLPIGITNTIVGIAVGYKTTVLPRKLEDVQKFLSGKAKEVKPFFKGFTGKITRFRGMDKTWLIEGTTLINESAQTIRITDLPPLMKYSSFLRKLNTLISTYVNAGIANNSSTNVDISITFKGSVDEWVSLKNNIEKSTKMLVTETPVFIKDGLVLEYDRIEDYITDYRYRLASLRVNRCTHFRDISSEELIFQKLKEKYLIFMLEGKAGKMHTDDKIDTFLSEISKGLSNGDTIRRRLNAILLRSLSEEELKRTQDKIKELTIILETQEQELIEATTIYASMEDTSMKRATQNRTNAATNLFIEEELDGIEVFTDYKTIEDHDDKETDGE